MVSPPLFVTGIGYLKLKDKPIPSQPCGTPRPEPALDSDNTTVIENTEADKTISEPALIGLVGGTTAATRGLQALIAAKELPNFEHQLVQYLRLPENVQQNPGHSLGLSSDPVCDKAGTTLVNIYPDHDEASRAFCRGDAFHYYLGDIDIIRTYAATIAGCNFDSSPITYTNDRYAIFGKAISKVGTLNQKVIESPLTYQRSETSRELLVAKFFEILSQKVLFNPSVLDKAYEDTFPDQPQSRKLKLFYWAIRGERAIEPHIPLYTQMKPAPEN